MDSVRAAREAGDRPATGAEAPRRSGVERAYRFYARYYDRLFGRVLGPGRRALAEAVAGIAPPTLLEVGVGTGLTLADYPASTRVTGIDVSAEMLQQAEQRAAAMPERDILLHRMDAEQMAFADASFDCVVLPYVLSVTPDPDRLVREVRRVCKPEGTVMILNHFSGSRFWWALERLVSPVADRIGFRSDFDFDFHVARHDWRIEQVRSVNLMGLSKLVRLRNAAGRNSAAGPQSNRTG